MTEARRNLLVGVFVLLGLLSLAVLVVLFGRGPNQFLQGNTYSLTIRFESVSGIRTGNLVTALGITIGRVVDVDLSSPDDFDGGVNVRVAIQDRYKLPQGSEARTTEPVLGQGRPPIEILPGPTGNPPLAAGATIPGSTRSAMDSIFPAGVVDTFSTAARQIGDAAEELTPVLTDLHDILTPRTPADVDRPGGLPGNLASSIARFDASLRHFNEVLGDPNVKGSLRTTVANLQQMSEQGIDVMDNLRAATADGREAMSAARDLVGNADQVLGHLDQNTTDLVRRTIDSLDRIDRVLDDIAVVTQGVRQGEGTLGHFVTDPELYDALVISANRLTEAVNEFKSLVAEVRAGKKLPIGF